MKEIEKKDKVTPSCLYKVRKTIIIDHERKKVERTLEFRSHTPSIAFDEAFQCYAGFMKEVYSQKEIGKNFFPENDSSEVSSDYFLKYKIELLRITQESKEGDSEHSLILLCAEEKI